MLWFEKPGRQTWQLLFNATPMLSDMLREEEN